MRTAIYVDGFNLYHSALEARPQYRWLDLHALASNALGAGHEIVRIRYFTSRIKGEDGDHDGPQRQDAYTRALCCACPNLTVHWGRFVQREKWRRLVEPMTRCLSPAPTKVLTWHREEKRSDVNLADHLLNDAWRDEYDCAVLLSDDSDLAEPLAMVRAMGKQVILLTPINLRENGERADAGPG
ncbi:NYN domain-containing protein [Lysobacter sp. A6]|uniref:NYN domain-containing protein n=1 Tax=Noviluteimonas lactosilytica TaxID=2888523 RepID=A0ABS8JKH2_9GAMM|nr:NYN domain-containing protein [Lysobacter lactosilyticus]MCC8364120.1 NYN domain-containing protein [Lysobacter lactosilyticus]